MMGQPPRYAIRFLRWFCREDFIDEVEGDLIELYEKEKADSARSKLKFMWHVMKYIRPEYLKSFKGKEYLNPISMIRHNFLITLRNIKRYKSTFAINLIGLSTGLAAVLLIWLWVNDELAVDKFHQLDERLFQVRKNGPNGDGTVRTFTNTPALMASSMAEELPEVEYAVAVLQRDKGIITQDNNRFKALHQFASADFFKAFSFRLLHGDPSKVLTEKMGVVISDQLAMKLFNTTENLLGKSIEWEWRGKFDGTYFITGVFETPPLSSTMKFDLVFTHQLYIEKSGDTFWGSNNGQTYIVLRADADPIQFNTKVIDYSRTKYEKLHGKEGVQYEGDVFIRKYSDSYLFGTYENGVQTGGRIEYVRLFSIVAIFILVIACINFMNLSTARASRRIKEIGIKKAVGAQRRSLIFQYLTEAMLISFLSLIVALVMVRLFLPAFSEITGKDLYLKPEWNFMLAVLGMVLFTGLISGSYPALYLSSFRPALVLKGMLKTSGGETWIRKGLVVFQFSVSIILIVSVVIVYKQIEFVQTKNLGYNRDNILTFENDGNLAKSAVTFLVEVKKLPGVTAASGMNGDFVGKHSGGGGIDWEGKDHGIEFSGFYMDFEMIELLNLQMNEGRAFSEQLGDREKVIFNETAIEMMKLKDPVGKSVKMWGQDREIVGIIKDFHYESLYSNVGPLFLVCTDRIGNTHIKIKAGEEQETIEGIQKLYNKFNPGLAFDYHFLDQDFETLYAAENRVAALSKYFAFIAILISCLGLFGLAAFSAERRMKEISIRKIMGASEMGIIRLLSGDFMRMVMLAILIAIPLSFFLSRQWLEAFAYRIGLEWWFFVGAGILSIVIAWVTVSVQTFKAARVNPVVNLKSE